MRYLLLFAFLSFQSVGATNERLQQELLEMEKQDQGIRNQIGEIGWENPPADLVEKMQKIDAKHSDRLKEIIDRHGWVTADLVGENGVAAAFIIIQHSPDYAFQEQMLPLLKQSYLDGEGVSGQDFALLADRVNVHNGEAQIYGTQLDFAEGGLAFSPIVDKENVDKRRAEVGLPPLEEYIKLIEEAYNMKVLPY